MDAKQEIEIFRKKEVEEGKISYCSLKLETLEDKKKAFSLISNPQHALRDMINKTISLRHVFAEQIQITKKDTGEVNDTVRMVLIDDKGVGYACVSKGVFNSMSRLLQLIGDPSTWEKPIDIIVKTKQIDKEKSCLVFDLA